jgi:hypothetical protein
VRRRGIGKEQKANKNRKREAVPPTQDGRGPKAIDTEAEEQSLRALGELTEHYINHQGPPIKEKGSLPQQDFPSSKH